MAGLTPGHLTNLLIYYLPPRCWYSNYYLNFTNYFNNLYFTINFIIIILIIVATIQTIGFYCSNFTTIIIIKFIKYY